ncbi:hypothetical protein D3C80_1114860 [compost metagenome]
MLKYLLAGALALVLLLGWKTNSLLDQVSTLEASLKSEQSLVEQKQKSLDDKIESCAADLQALSDAHAVEKRNSEASQATLDKLSTVPPVTPKETKKNVPKEATGTPTVFSLNPEYVRVLNESYCHGRPTDPYCTAK